MTTTYDIDNEPVHIAVPNGTEAYWEGWAEGIATSEVNTIVRTIRLGDTGRSDAQYIIDRLASGLHGAHIVEGW